MRQPTMQRLIIYAVIPGLLLVSCGYRKKLTAEKIELPALFTSGMVLPVSPSTRIWGMAEPGATLAVRISEYVRLVKANEQGKWTAEFPVIVLDRPFSIRVEGKDTVIILNNIQSGELLAIAGDAGLANRLIADQSCGSNDQRIHYKIRVFNPDLRFSQKPLEDYEGGRWTTSEEAGKSVKTCKALRLIRDLHQTSSGSIGVIDLTWPATSLANWFPAEIEKNRVRPVSDPAVLQRVNDSVAKVISAMFDTSRNGIADRAMRFWYNDEAWPLVNMPARFPVHAENKKITYFRKRIYIPSKYLNSDFQVNLGRIHGSAEIEFNETPLKVYRDSSGISHLHIPDTLMRVWTNLLCIRLTGNDLFTGFFSGPFNCFNADSGYYRDISEDWKFNSYLEPDFPKFQNTGTLPGIASYPALGPLGDYRPYSIIFYASNAMMGVDSLSAADIRFLNDLIKTRGSNGIFAVPQISVNDTLIYKLNTKLIERNLKLIEELESWRVVRPLEKQ